MDRILDACMELLWGIAALRTPALDAFFALVTRLGEETLFIAVALLFFWCVDKRKGYYILYVGLAGTIVNQWLKILCCIPRPWVLDPSFPIVESARAAATGFSFPSGHTQSAAGIGLCVARTSQKKWLRALCVAAVLLVGFSRMYLGVHTLLDVGVSLLAAALLALLLYPLFFREGNGRDALPGLLAALLCLALGFLAYMLYAPLRVPADDANVLSGVKNAYTFLGTVSGFALVVFLERRYVHFDTDAVWWAQILKLALGLGLILAVKGGLKQPLLALLGGSGFSHSLRYFIAIVIGGGFYPMLFRYLPRRSRSRV